ncbi:MAG: TonB-dependent receptor [Acidobacteriota bacterium]|nr:TonB-dependent receptor [Acidobacteriota bacterium]
MRLVSALFCSVLLALSAFAQNDRGTITGEVKDQGGAVIPNATVVAINTANGAQFKTTTTATGNYTIPSLPVGRYSLSVEVTGFRKFVQQNIEIQVSITNRIDITLQVGATSDTVTVTAEAPQLKTENAEQSTIIQTSTVDALPLNFGGGGGSSGNIRSPFAFNVLSPGVGATGNASGDNNVVNGQTTFRIQVEGQDTTSQNDANWTSTVSHGSVDAIEEFSLQTSNFAAEFSQVGGAFYNFTTKSGSNNFHGTAYEYLTNEDLDAYRPYFTPTVPSTNPRSRKNDFGFTVGGPVWIPKVYNGRNKTFFFFSEEVFRNVTYPNGSAFLTFPTTAMRGGDFSSNAIFPGQNLGTDPGGNPLINGAIYDPASRTTLSSGKIVATAFPGNIIPTSRLDPTALKVQNLIPVASNANQTANWVENCAIPNNQQTPTVKIDQILPDSSKLSFYFNKLTTNQLTTQNCMPYPIAVVRVQAIYGTVPRLNYDKSVTPTLLLHAGLGYQRFHNPDSSPAEVLDYDAAGKLGIKGSATNPSGFPELIFNGSGEQTLGPTNANSYFDGTFTASTSLTWVHGNHTSKIGGEWRLASWTDRNSRGAQGVYQFQPDETADPYNNTSTVNGNGIAGHTGNSYASFLLGLVDTATVNSVQDPQLRRQAWGLFIQDTWKITSKLTLDYGLRWDLQDWGHEIHYRWTEFGPTVPNPVVNNIPGAILYSGYGSGRCNCTFSSAYPYSIAPRLGVAYQINQKTVFRGGWGLTYAPISTFAYITNAAILGVGYNLLNFPAPAFGVPTTALGQGLVYNPSALTTASLGPGLYSNPSGVPSSAPFYIDPNAGRAPRIMQWSLGFQREVARNLVLEANFVGNTGVWLNNATFDGGLNTINPATFANYGIDPTTTAGQTILGGSVASARKAGYNIPSPYPTFPTTQTVLQAIKPFPQNSNAERIYGAPLGNSWYDSLQIKVTKRLSNGLNVQSAFTWSKSLATPANGVGNIFNRDIFKGYAGTDQPLIFNTGFTYELQKYGFLGSNKFLRDVIAGWTVSGLLAYSSGLPIPTPTSANTTYQEFGQSTLENRVPGQPLYIKDLNCNCINPTGQFVLNPAAWANPAPGTWSTSAPYYGDFRYTRRPAESMSIGRVFRIREHRSLEVRAEFFNVFNRKYLNNPAVTNPQGNRGCTITTPTPGMPNSVTVPAGTFTCPAGYSSPSGFGAIGYTGLAVQPRNGQIVARFTF